jgi:hypothetical protein
MREPDRAQQRTEEEAERQRQGRSIAGAGMSPAWRCVSATPPSRRSHAHVSWVASMAIWLVVVVMTLVDPTPRISNRTVALCTPIAARPNIEATTTGISNAPKRGRAAKVAAKATSSSVSSASAAASGRRATPCPATAAIVAATPPAKNTGTASTTAAPGHPATGRAPAST